MARLYVTYGCGYAQRGCYSVVEGVDEVECQKKIDLVTGGRYAFAYRPEEFEPVEGNEGQVAKWGLRRIPLQPMHETLIVEPYADEMAKASSRFD